MVGSEHLFFKAVFCEFYTAFVCMVCDRGAQRPRHKLI